MVIKIEGEESLAGCMLIYAGGGLLRKFKLYDVDLRKPVWFDVPWFHVRVERCIRKFCLEDVTREGWLESKKLMAVLDRSEEMKCIGGLRLEEYEKVWRMVSDKKLVN